MHNKPILSIGNKNYSSWSLRPWLAMRWAGIAFQERVIPLGPRGAGPNEAILAINPAGTVPVLELHDGAQIWDSLAICEWANDAAQNSLLWPTDPVTRAIARSAVAEMHAGFAPLRMQFPMNLKRIKHDHVWDEAASANIARIDALLGGLVQRFDLAGSGWLFGHRTIVDAFYAPVATRFRTYQVPLSPLTQKWCDTLYADPEFQAWERDALRETWVIGETDTI